MMLKSLRSAPSAGRRLALGTFASALTLALAACSSAPKLPPLPAVTGSASVATVWQTSIGGKQMSALAPAVQNGKVYAAHPNGNLFILDEKSGAVLNQTQIELPRGTLLSGGVAVAEQLIVVGTNKGDVHALDLAGKRLWSGKVSSEIVAPPAISEQVVAVSAVDGSITGLDNATGERKWIIQRTLPALTVRASSIPVAHRGAVFVGTPQGKLLGFDGLSGAIGWEATVANPRGTSELERLVDVVGRPVLDASRICTSAYRGRAACFDQVRGTLLWSREVSSLIGVVIDENNVYTTDDKGAVFAFDKSTGGTVWTQNALAGRSATGAALIGDFYAVQDHQGNLHLLDRKTGKIEGRGLGDNFIANAPLTQTDNGALLQTERGAVLLLQAR